MKIYKSENVERNDNMSLCGMTVFSDGIVAFGDSKATTVDKNGNRIEYIDRHPQKILKSSALIVATTGYNYIIDRISHTQYQIEEILDSLLQETLESIVLCRKFHGNDRDMVLRTYEEFVEHLCSVCQYSVQCNGKYQYSFIIGALDPVKGYFIQGISITEKGTEIGERIYGIPDIFSTIYIGDESYTEPLSKLKWEKPLKINEYSSIIADTLLDLIRINDRILGYNPVGGEVLVETFA